MFYVNCPHCLLIVEIREINCSIFRHGVYKLNYRQIDPHLNKEQCDYLFNNNLIYGCGKPFRIIDNIAVICDYI